jgi:hypothetical protein
MLQRRTNRVKSYSFHAHYRQDQIINSPAVKCLRGNKSCCGALGQSGVFAAAFQSLNG